jgi:hypothetical protein
MPATDKKKADEAAVLAAIAAMKPEAYRVIGERLHTIITTAAPGLMPRTWYGMPAYSNGDKILCFFRGSEKFGERYVTLGFNPEAKLDEGTMWPIAYALTELTDTEADKIEALIKRAASKV